MAIVETRKLTKVFKQGELGAVNDVSLVTHEGEFLVFLGPSGSGKTTLLRMIAGLETPTSGEILIGGNVVNDLSPRERRIAMVFQSYALYPHLTVYKNIAFPLKAQGVPKAEHRKKVEWAAGLLGIGRLLDRKPRELSGGERQRVALARAIVREPAVFLLDEPLSNLDAKLRASAREELERFHTSVGTTTIYVTHDQVEAMAMGDRIVVMNFGEVRQIGTPAEVYDDPADTFVATFLGSPPMNLVEKDDIVVGFRPEHFFPVAVLADRAAVPEPIRAGDREGPSVPLSLRVSHEEYLGAERIVYGAIEGGAFHGRKVISRLASTLTFPCEPGGIQAFAVTERHLKFYDRASGKRTAARPHAWP
ncbi:MAG TPA: ATP-binding cassette domain-containing protein [Thermoanaerobaculia bacterium]|nr:ATP-binding cassette domain-containing protein [Thermoanaerobaculia bacterium]